MQLHTMPRDQLAFLIGLLVTRLGCEVTLTKEECFDLDSFTLELDASNPNGDITIILRKVSDPSGAIH